MLFSYVICTILTKFLFVSFLALFCALLLTFTALSISTHMPRGTLPLFATPHCSALCTYGSLPPTKSVLPWNWLTAIFCSQTGYFPTLFSVLFMYIHICTNVQAYVCMHVLTEYIATSYMDLHLPGIQISTKNSSAWNSCKKCTNTLFERTRIFLFVFFFFTSTSMVKNLLKQ